MISPASLKIAIAQLNPVVGDLEGNARRAEHAHADAKKLGADVVVFPELFLNGYPPEDLVLKPAFQDETRRTLERLAERCKDGPAVVIGAIWREKEKPHNAVAVLDGGRIASISLKYNLPNYGVFDEKRVFAPGPMPGPVNIRGVRIGLPICEDIWEPEVVETLAETGAELIVSPNGSPFDWPKFSNRMNAAIARVTESGLPLMYVNQVGGQDELVFDGASFVLNSDRSLPVQLPAWREGLLVTEWEKTPNGWRCKPSEVTPIAEGAAAAYHASVLGLRDYVTKNRFPGVVLGLSGGIDSALVAAIAVDALGSEKVHAVMLPSKFTSDESLADAAACAKTLGIRYDKISIEPTVSALTWSLKDIFAGTNSDITEENLQSRVRGTILMAISNKFGHMVVTTGNKSEMSVGYATLYGDMNGGFNPIKDLYKTEVYQLSNWRNENVPEGGLGPAGTVIPERIITKAPTAELRANQTDQDSLPPYDELDDILRCLVENEMPVADVVARGHSAETVGRVERLLYLAEYKRRQAAPGIKISARSFGRDRRYPITNWFRETTSTRK
ncbi:NAD+ synthase [Hyphomicrobium methylovorum]|uniref:NAD+ synthase n=1 Tax=Hyphomicrobium methylovorum TaxID=84 RepID=UPI0015E70AF1|nr:NAD+ synthase [Hyphomicrobium methylovorum]MBA2124860.1 NAD+ synthase [Hyphomicrobium methylovorum]